MSATAIQLACAVQKSLDVEHPPRFQVDNICRTLLPPARYCSLTAACSACSCSNPFVRLASFGVVHDKGALDVISFSTEDSAHNSAIARAEGYVLSSMTLTQRSVACGVLCGGL